MRGYIESQQFRIGNYFINGADHLDQITGVLKQHIAGLDGMMVPSPGAKGVPLTDNWLWRLGFEKHQDSMLYKKGKFFLHSYLPMPEPSYCFQYNDYKSREIQFVHELQNMYYALTGPELTVSVEQSGITG